MKTKKLTELELDYLEEFVEDEEEEEEDENEIDRGDAFQSDEEDEEDEDDVEDEDEEDEAEEDEDDVEDEDDEDEDEDEDEKDDEDEEDDEDEDEEDDNRIPRGRLNEVLKQRDDERSRVKWLEDRLEQIIGKKEAESVVQEALYDFDKAEEDYVDMVLEGDKVAARELRKQITVEQEKLFKAQLAVLKRETAEEVEHVSKKSLDDQKFDDILDRATSQYKFLNHTSKAYNEKAIKLANTLMKGYISDGEVRSEALRKAVDEVVPLFNKTAPAKERDKSARRKAVDAARKQPTATTNQGSDKGKRDLDNIRIDKISEKDFNSLTSKEKAILRGDAM